MNDPANDAANGAVNDSERPSSPAPALFKKYWEKRWFPYALLALFALLYAASQPSWSFSWLGWTAAAPLLLALRRAETWRRAFWLGWIGGFGAFLGVIGWLYKVGVYSGVGPPFGVLVGVFGALILAAYLALYTALFAVLAAKALPRSGRFYAVGAASHWVVCEWLRGWMLTGFPWGTLGSSQWNSLPIAQLAALGGVPLISFVLMAFNASAARALFAPPPRGRRLLSAASALVLPALALLYGALTLNFSVEPSGETIRFAVAPGNIPQDERWRRSILGQNFNRYMQLMEAALEEEPDAVVLPETAILLSHLGKDSQNRFRRFSQENNVHLLYGTTRYDSAARASYNSAVAVNRDGSDAGIYDKRHLVPFGEYIPLREILPKTLVEKIIGIGDYGFGEDWNLLRIAGAKAGVPICFESVFPEISREFVRRGADLLIVITNDGWYDGTAAIPQHNAFSVFRAIENRRWLVRSANRGVSCFIDPYGRIADARVEPDDRDGTAAHDALLRTDRTVYNRFGDWISYLSILATCAAVGATLAAGVRRRRAGADPHETAE